MEFKMIFESFLSFESPNTYDLESNLILPTNDDIKLIGNRKLIKLWNKQYGNLSTSDLQLIINAKLIKMFSVNVNKFWNIGERSETLVDIFNWIWPIILSFYQNNRDCLDCIFNKLSQSLRDVPNFKCSCLMGYGVKELLEIIVTLLHNNEDIN
ncbi:unnamed protein product [Phyllotreta striolata]|uniref:Uncharacterized protein n=1 Tax=Phyllotreta striolata TaxID=444603 RepID=A0A9N9TGZ3_PHYSR|nr:unnamed protein product [Phyllotreta striolata]